MRATIRRVTECVPFYREKLRAAGVAADDIRSLADVRRLPFTTKADLRENYPYGLFAVPMREVVRIHASSGTTGLATVVGYTRNDIRTWSNLVARIITMGFGATLCFLSLAVVLVKTVPVALIAICFVLFGHSALSANMFAAISDLFPGSAVARVTGLTGIAGGISGMLFPLLTGWLVDHISYTPVFAMASPSRSS